jgi:hypothetical protein
VREGFGTGDEVDDDAFMMSSASVAPAAAGAGAAVASAVAVVSAASEDVKEGSETVLTAGGAAEGKEEDVGDADDGDEQEKNNGRPNKGQVSGSESNREPAVAVPTKEKPTPEAARELRWQRKATHAVFVACVQQLSSARQLLAAVMCLEQAMPRGALPVSHRWLLARDSAPTATTMTTIAHAAARLFSLDRSVRYERLPLDVGYSASTYRPQTLLGARCTCSMKCGLTLGHVGRCIEIFKDFSRVPAVLDSRAIDIEMSDWLKRAPRLSITGARAKGRPRRGSSDDESESEDEFEGAPCAVAIALTESTTCCTPPPYFHRGPPKSPQSPQY